MPVNSFENYILSWKPERSQLKSPLYISLADLMEKDILSGTLAAGTKLPPQRELADYLDVSLNTITRAYTLCEKKGLLFAVTGKGTFVNGAINTRKTIVEPETNTAINISSTISPMPNTERLCDIIKSVISDSMFEKSIQYSTPIGTEYQQKAAEKWLNIFGFDKCNNVLITEGSQNSLTLILTSLFESGDKIVVDQYTYPNFLSLANLLHITLVPVSGDEKGMDPAELAKILNTNSVKGIYLSPTCSNPQAICMPENRRKEIAHLIERHNLILIEDDCYAFIAENKPQPVSLMTGNNYIYLTELNKAISPAVNMGIICCSDRFLPRLQQANYSCNLVVNWFAAQVGALAINQDIYADTIDEHRRRIQNRNMIYGRYFEITNINSYYQWLPLPSGISSTVFESVAMKAGVKVYGSERFLTGDAGGRYYLRISPTGPRTVSQLETALRIIRKIIDDIQNNTINTDYTV
ncbi:MAG: PLP-dependent aminotransferase family protein [Oscillospiraceae bacterium]|nr:PLP-dependent aminotransferase family protein [Oscillospiraceae bacterium]